MAAWNSVLRAHIAPFLRLKLLLESRNRGEVRFTRMGSNPRTRKSGCTVSAAGLAIVRKESTTSARTSHSALRAANG